MNTTLVSIIELARRGVAPRDIAAELDISVGHVHNSLSRARRTGKDIPRYRGPHKVQVLSPQLLASEAVTILRRDAERRGISLSELCYRILSIVGSEGLTNAILDDGDE